MDPSCQYAMSRKIKRSLIQLVYLKCLLSKEKKLSQPKTRKKAGIFRGKSSFKIQQMNQTQNRQKTVQRVSVSMENNNWDKLEKTHSTVDSDLCSIPQIQKRKPRMMRNQIQGCLAKVTEKSLYLSQSMCLKKRRRNIHNYLKARALRLIQILTNLKPRLERVQVRTQVKIQPPPAP